MELFHLTSSKGKRDVEDSNKGKRDVEDIGHASCTAHHNTHHMLYAYTKSKDVGHLKFYRITWCVFYKIKNVLNKDIYTMNF